MSPPSAPDWYAPAGCHAVPSYALEFRRSARKELESLPDAVLARVWERVEALADDPRPHGCKKLRGANDLWRIRVGTYRVVYHLDDAARTIVIAAIGDRKDVYR